MKKDTILVVDDTIANIEILSSILSDYDVIALSNGYEGIEAAQNESIDLILLDIMMPQIDGYEVCKILKADEKTAQIPIIFITAKTLEEDITHGFSLGAVDYITKPFNPSELLARVKTHLQLQRYKNELQKKVEDEVEKNRIKQQMLFQHSKQAAIGELLMHIAHQWKQPISELGALNLFTLSKLGLNQELSHDEILQNCQKSEKVLKFMSQTVETFQNFYQPCTNDKMFDINDALNQACNIVSATYDYFGIKIYLNTQNNLSVYGNENEYAQVFLNLLNNAKDIFVKKQIQNPYVQITLKKEDAIVLTFQDNGGGFEEEFLKKAFLPHVSNNGSTGLGLYMSKAIIEKNGASLQIQNTNEGAKITIRC